MPANTTNTIFVVWPQEVLDKVGVVQPLTFGELVNTEGLQLSPSQAAAFEAGPQFQGTIPGIADIISVVRNGRSGGRGGMTSKEGEGERLGTAGGRGGMTSKTGEGEREGTAGGRGGMTSRAGEGESPSTRLPPQRPPGGGPY